METEENRALGFRKGLATGVADVAPLLVVMDPRSIDCCRRTGRS